MPSQDESRHQGQEFNDIFRLLGLGLPKQSLLGLGLPKQTFKK